MGDIENGWIIFKRHHVAPGTEPAAEAHLKLAFFLGALQHHHVLNDAAKLEMKLAEMTVQAVDAEIARFAQVYGKMTAVRGEKVMGPPLVVFQPIAIITACPKCEEPHTDTGEWATKPHKTHLCALCGHEWTPCNWPTVGVDALP